MGSAQAAAPYRWVILGVCTVLIGVVSIIWHAFSVFLVALTGSFGWSRAETSLGFTIFVISSGVTGPNTGQLIARFGARRVVVIGGIVLAGGLAATSRMNALWQFYLCFGVIAGVGFSLSGWIPVVTLLQSWFRARLGLATGIASAGVGVGIMTLVPAIQTSITNLGWRTTYLLVGLLTLIVVLPIALFIREGPFAGRGGARLGPRPEHDPLVRDRAWVSRPWTLRLALRSRRYWCLLGGVFLASFATQQLLAHHVAYLRGSGYSAITAATVIGVVGIASIPARIGWGVASDRFGREIVYSAGLLLVIVAIATLWLVPTLGFAGLPYIYAVLLGAGYVSSSTMPPLLTADMFRGATYAAIFGGVSLASNLGSGVGALLAGFIYDHTGSYHLAFVIATGGVVVSGVLIWLAAPRRIRRVPRSRAASEERATPARAGRERAAAGERVRA